MTKLLDFIYVKWMWKVVKLKDMFAPKFMVHFNIIINFNKKFSSFFLRVVEGEGIVELIQFNQKIIIRIIEKKFPVPDTIIQVLLESSSESITIGDRAWFDCKVTGDPEAEITWTKEGEDLPDNAQVKKFFFLKNTALLLLFDEYCLNIV